MLFKIHLKKDKKVLYLKIKNLMKVISLESISNKLYNGL